MVACHPGAMTSIRVGGRWRGRLLERAAFVVAISVAVEARAGGNAAPSVPVLNNPSATTVATTTTPVYSWQPSIDPEGDAITYEVEVRDSSDVVVGARSGITGTVTAFDRELVQYADYTWRARATDSQGASSEFSPQAMFQICAPVDRCAPPIEPPVDDGGCAASPSPAAGAALLLGLALVVRRRRWTTIT